MNNYHRSPASKRRSKQRRNQPIFSAGAKHKLRWLPNTLTLCNSWCGFASILWTLTVYERVAITGVNQSQTYDVLAISALIILGAMIFDVLDGFAARMLNATSMHGLQMDSLSDMVTFGVAPAVLMAVMTHWLQGKQTTVQLWVTYILCAIYVGCTALRLATYNVKAMEKSSESNVFHGLPSPGAAAAIAILVLAMRVFDRDLSNLALILPIYAAVLGFLMVSALPYRHVGKWLLSKQGNQSLKIMILIVMLFLVGLFREYAIFGIITIYVLSGPAEALKKFFLPGRKHI